MSHKISGVFLYFQQRGKLQLARDLPAACIIGIALRKPEIERMLPTEAQTGW